MKDSEESHDLKDFLNKRYAFNVFLKKSIEDLKLEKEEVRARVLSDLRKLVGF